MLRLLVCGAGGAPSNNFIRSLRESDADYYIIGTSSLPTDLFLADIDERHVVPRAIDPSYWNSLSTLLTRSKPAFIHAQNDYEVRAISRLRDKIMGAGVELYLPAAETVEACVDKGRTYEIWSEAGIKVAATIKVKDDKDLKLAFDRFGPTIWLRAVEGGGGRGALPTDSYELAHSWINRFEGWGEFTASELLSKDTVTWQSIWHEGELVVAQSRRRLSWNFGDRTLSGVTGITGVGETCSDEVVDRIALDSIRAVDDRPHGIFSVDLTYDFDGVPRPTEINIGRFFTTHYFFTACGLNFPKIYCDIALEGKFPVLERTINPLPEGMLWIRGMDVEPKLVRREELDRLMGELG